MRYTLALCLCLYSATFAAAAPTAGKLVLVSGRALPAIAYEIAGDQVKVTQPDRFVLYLPLQQVDLEATASTLGAPGPPPKPGDMRVLRVERSVEERRAQLGLVESLEAWKRGNPGRTGGTFSVVSTSAAQASGEEVPAAESAEAPAESRIERAREPDPPGGESTDRASMQARRRELAQRLYEMETRPARFSEAEVKRLRDEIDAFDQQLYEGQQKTWQEHRRP